MFSLRRSPLLSHSRYRPTCLCPNLCWRQTRWLRTIKHPDTHSTDSSWSKTGPWIIYPTCAVIFGAACFVTYQTSQPFRHSLLAFLRCSRVAGKMYFFFQKVTRELMYMWLIMQVPPYLARLTTK